MVRTRNPPQPEMLLDAPPGRALAAWLAALEAAGALAPTAVESCSVDVAAGRFAAADVRARHPNPPHRCAAMDGIAVRAAETAGAPVVLAPGAFAPIDTGQHVAPEWDAIVPLEELDQLEAGARVRHAAEPGSHVRPAGEDIAAGALVVGAGRRLGPADLALAVACGHAALPVRAHPRVALIPTGDEVRPAGSELAPGEIPDANSVMLAATLRAAGAVCEVLPITADRPTLLEPAVRAAAARNDLVLVLAGSSRGTRDHTATVLERAGALIVRGVALRPAHPVLLAVVDATPVVGVPGYPVSAALACERFAEPVIAALLGRRAAPPHHVRRRARAAGPQPARRRAGRPGRARGAPGRGAARVAAEPPRRSARRARQGRRDPVGPGGRRAAGRRRPRRRRAAGLTRARPGAAWARSGCAA